VLLPVLTALPQPLALLEDGASAGLCLYPDRYAYRYGEHGSAPENPSSSARRSEWPQGERPYEGAYRRDRVSMRHTTVSVAARASTVQRG
jgi:hypothetical protein